MDVVLKIIYCLGATCIGAGIGFTHYEEKDVITVGVGMITGGIVLIGIAAGLI